MTTQVPSRMITTTGVVAGSYTAANITVNESGQITSASSGATTSAVEQADIGTAPNEIPLNQYLGNLAYQDASSISVVTWQAVQTAAFTAIAGMAYPCNTTSAAFTVTLPASPAAGNVITLLDYAGTWGTNNLTINPNGGKIRGLTDNAVVSVSNNSVQLVYVDSTQGWLVYSAVTATPFMPPTTSIDYLVVAGGGGGGWAGVGGGGGAGGFITGASVSVASTPSLTVTVGTGGAAPTSGTRGGSGTNSSITGTSFTTITSTGGGGGGTNNAGSTTGLTGGSGGGGGGDGSYAGGVGNTPSTSPSQGNSGGSGTGGGVSYSGGGGGGGASGAGSNGSGAGGNGGAGSEWPTGSGVYYAGGGGGNAGYTGPAGTGGTGGGGNAGSAGTNGKGGGGGGSAKGGDGIVIIRYADTFRSATTTGSPTVSVSGGYRTYTFTGNGSITF